MEQLETSEEAKARGANAVSFPMFAVVLAIWLHCVHVNVLQFCIA